ncbi:MAG: hypothetical protein LUC43_04665 [Burkholderiales bacterium]|nr:hypothetical protein [Burkholderiales bacterium]
MKTATNLKAPLWSTHAKSQRAMLLFCLMGIFCGVGLAESACAEEHELTSDEEWGCQVLLCMANPNGPKAVSECVPPITKLYSCLYRIKNPCSFPTCPMAGDGNYAKPLSDTYDPCTLQDMEDAPAGWIMQGNLTDTSKFSVKGHQYHLKAGGSSYNYAGTASDGSGNSSKACVRNLQGTALEPYQCQIDSGESSYWTTCYRQVKVYEEVTWQQQQSSRAVDVFIEGNLWTRIHW